MPDHRFVDDDFGKAPYSGFSLSLLFVARTCVREPPDFPNCSDMESPESEFQPSIDIPLTVFNINMRREEGDVPKRNRLH